MRILVVEDNGELVGLLTKALARAGLDVDAARNAADAESSLFGSSRRLASRRWVTRLLRWSRLFS